MSRLKRVCMHGMLFGVLFALPVTGFATNSVRGVSDRTSPQTEGPGTSLETQKERHDEYVQKTGGSVSIYYGRPYGRGYYGRGYNRGYYGRGYYRPYYRPYNYQYRSYPYRNYYYYQNRGW